MSYDRFCESCKRPDVRRGHPLNDPGNLWRTPFQTERETRLTLGFGSQGRILHRPPPIEGTGESRLVLVVDVDLPAHWE
jgi:hypothetical protein